jgi:hypothetical protein
VAAGPTGWIEGLFVSDEDGLIEVVRAGQPIPGEDALFEFGVLTEYEWLQSAFGDEGRVLFTDFSRIYRAAPCADSDGDRVCDTRDNCPFEPNPEQNPVACLCGDADGDRERNFLDARLILLGQVPAEGERKCDVNGDGECNSIDARLILLGQMPSPPVCPAATTPP